jgi:adenylylsulfate kinase
VPGSGKSAIARAAATALAAGGEFVHLLELDVLRRTLTPAPMYDETERQAVYRALVVIAHALTDAGVPVIIDATAHRREWRDLARASIVDFGEVQLLCPLEVARERERTRGPGHHPPGIYARAGEPGATIPGVNVPYEPAIAPELTIDTTRETVQGAGLRVAALVRTLLRKPSYEPVTNGLTLWVTGCPGSGKTSVVSGVCDHLRRRDIPVTVLDPRDFGARVAPGRNWSHKERQIITHALVLAAQLLSEAGVAVLIDGAPPLPDGIRLAREVIRHYARVELVCAPDVGRMRARAVRWGLIPSPAPSLAPAMPDIAVEDEPAITADLVLYTDALDGWTTLEEVMQLVDRLLRAARETPHLNVHRA